MLIIEGTNAGLAVNGFARSALASLAGRLRPLTAALRRGPRVTGNPAQITTGTTLMNSSIDPTSQTIQAREVGNDERLQMLPRHFGRHMLTVENAVYAFMRKLANQYTGGYWTFFELSNGGFYIAPQCGTTFNIFVEGNGFEGAMSADASALSLTCRAPPRALGPALSVHSGSRPHLRVRYHGLSLRTLSPVVPDPE